MELKQSIATKYKAATELKFGGAVEGQPLIDGIALLGIQYQEQNTDFRQGIQKVPTPTFRRYLKNSP